MTKSLKHQLHLHSLISFFEIIVLFYFSLTFLLLDVPGKNSKVIDISAGPYHSVLLTNDGYSMFTGAGKALTSLASTSIISNVFKFTTIQGPPDRKIIRISCGDSLLILISELGDLYAASNYPPGKIYLDPY